MYRKGYDHVKSSTVDVVKHAYGEFVQVWDAPFKIPGRRLQLTYRRNGEDVSDITTHEYLDSGVFSKIIRGSNYVSYFYRDKKHQSRLERKLPNGKLLISDEPNLLYVKAVFTADFNFEKLTPKGRKMGDRAVMKRQINNEQYFVATYQQYGDNEPRLAMVQEYLGKNIVSTYCYEFEQGN
ncbi:MAG: hypothetical protein ACRBBR_16880 [Cellvibrionaceae bacterium]